MKRIISKLDVKVPNLVKCVCLEGLRALGELSLFAKKYFNKIINEIIYHDCVTSLYDRKSFLELIKKIYIIETLDETDFAPSIKKNSFIPNAFIDIIRFMRKKSK